jgi:integrase
MNASSIKTHAANGRPFAPESNPASSPVGQPDGDGHILPSARPRVKAPLEESNPKTAGSAKRGRPKRTRRQAHGSAWHWKQTDCWYYTLAGTKKRIPLFDDDGKRIRGIDQKKAAQLAMARVKLDAEWRPTAEAAPGSGEWLVAKVCSEYIQYCERGVAKGTISSGHCTGAVAYLNDLCTFCGALPVAQLKKGHVQSWVEGHTGWKSTATQRNVIAIVLAAFNYAQQNHDIPNPLKGLKKPLAHPRLHSLSREDEQALYAAADEIFKDFLFAAIHTGLRPFCELAKMTADDVEETPRGMMWRVYSSKTKKTRKIPVMAEVATLTRKLMKTAPAGSGKPLLRNRNGDMWQKVTGVTRFLALKRKLGWDKDPIRSRYSSYSCRHTFAHRMLSGYWNGGQGCSIEILAEMIGDTPKVAFDHYGREWGQHYQDPLWAAIGGVQAKDADTSPKTSRRARVERRAK